jgi:hypothetical protein
VRAHPLPRHHSAVGRATVPRARGLVARRQDSDNVNVARLRLTEWGACRLEELGELLLGEFAHLALTMHALGQALKRATTANCTRLSRRSAPNEPALERVPICRRAWANPPR